MYDPAKPAGNKTTVITIPTRADHGNSEDGVLGMSLQPGFDLSDPAKRNVFVYYSPRNPDWPTTGNVQVVGYNQISRFTLTADGTAAVPNSERVILRVPKAKISGSPSGFPGGPTDSGPGHVGGAGLDFDSAGNLYLGVGDDVSPNAPGHNGYTPMDYRSKERWDARKTSQPTPPTCAARSSASRPSRATSPADTEPGVDATYAIPAGNLFPVGTAKTRPEIYAMGFRQPFTVHTDPANPGLIGMGEYCHDNGANGANRSPAGICEWNLINKAGNFGWPFCVGDNSPANTNFRWNYATPPTTGQQYDCSTATMPSDIRYAPDGQTPVEPTFDGLDTLPEARSEGDDLEEVPERHGRPERGRLRRPQRRRHAADHRPDLPLRRGQRPARRVPALLRRLVADQQPRRRQRLLEGSQAPQGQQRDAAGQATGSRTTRGVNPSGANSEPRDRHAVRPGRRALHGPLLGRLLPRRTRAPANSDADREDLVQRPGRVPDRHRRAERRGRGHRPGVPGPARHVRQLGDAEADGDRLRLRGREVDRVPRAGARRTGCPTRPPSTFTAAKNYTIEYRATDRKDNVSAVKTTTFEVLEINDTTAPTATAATTGNQDQRNYFIGSATLTLTATDDATGSGIDKIEYRVNGGAYTTYTAPVAFNTPGTYDVDYRATDKVGNVSAVKTISFRILSGAGCTAARSDEFDGTTLGAQWQRHTRNGGTPASAFTFVGRPAAHADGGLRARRGQRHDVGRPGELHRPGPGGAGHQLDRRDRVHGQVHGRLAEHRPDHLQRRQQLRPFLDHAQPRRRQHLRRAVQGQPVDDRGRARPGRQQHHDRCRTRTQAVTIRMRYDARQRLQHRHARSTASWPRPASRWPTGRTSAAPSNFVDLNPASGARRDAAGSRIGIITASNFPGTDRHVPVRGHAGHGRRQLLPGHPGPAHLRDGRPDHDGDARPGRSGDRRHVRPRRSRSTCPRSTPAPTPPASRRPSTASPPTARRATGRR